MVPTPEEDQKVFDWPKWRILRTFCGMTDWDRTLLEEELHADLSFEAKGGAMKVHRCILAIRSPMFEAMFWNEMQEESHELVIKVPDITIDALRVFLHFLYRGVGFL